MNKVKFLSIICILLVICNIALISFLLINRHGPPRRHHGPRDLIIDKLHFDKNQATKYDKLIEWHRSEMDKHQNDMMYLKHSLYHQLAFDSTSSTKDSLINQISLKQIEIEKTNYKHFEDIKKICNNTQLKAFDNLTNELANMFGHHNGPPHHHEK